VASAKVISGDASWLQNAKEAAAFREFQTGALLFLPDYLIYSVLVINVGISLGHWMDVPLDS
jgi:hypothetical protein